MARWVERLVRRFEGGGHPKAEVLPSKLDLRAKTYEWLNMVRSPTSEEMKKLGKDWISLDIQAKSLQQVVDEDPSYFGYVDESRNLRDYVPPAMTIVINPKDLGVSNSFNWETQMEHLAITEKQSQIFERIHPEAKKVMLPASAYVQADKLYRKKTGEKLFTDLCALVLDQYGDSSSGLFVGRSLDTAALTDRLFVGGFLALNGHASVSVVPAVVFIRK